MTESKYAQTQHLDPQGAMRRFSYYLLEQQEGCGTICCQLYGVRVVEEGVCETHFPALTTSRTQALSLLGLLERNAVGPTGLADVITDYKKECVG